MTGFGLKELIMTLFVNFRKFCIEIKEIKLTLARTFKSKRKIIFENCSTKREKGVW